MLLTLGAVIEFVSFVQILCWIILPVFLAAVALTIYLHYRKKKRNQQLEEDADDMVLAVPEKFNHRKPDGEYILFDHSELIGEYKKRISCHQAKYTALHHDFTQLESKYSALAHYTAGQFNHHKNYAMDNQQEALPQHVKEEINLLVQQHAAEKRELEIKLEQLAKSYESLEQENESLQEDIKLEQATDEEKEVLINKWKAENNILKEKISEQDYLKDILDEKKSQIIFLQNQLEQRIIQTHQSETQRNEISTAYRQLQTKKAEESATWQNDLAMLKKELDHCNHLLQDRQQKLDEHELTLASRTNHIKSLEDSISSLVLHLDTAQTQLREKQASASLYEEQWKAELEHSHQLEEKLSDQRQSLRRIQAAFAQALNEDDQHEESPVIAMRPGYSTAESQESALS